MIYEVENRIYEFDRRSGRPGKRDETARREVDIFLFDGGKKPAAGDFPAGGAVKKRGYDEIPLRFFVQVREMSAPVPIPEGITWTFPADGRSD